MLTLDLFINAGILFLGGPQNTPITEDPDPKSICAEQRIVVL